MSTRTLIAIVTCAFVAPVVAAGTVTFVSAHREVRASASGISGGSCTTVTSAQMNDLFGPWQTGVAPPAFAQGSATQVSTVSPDTVAFGSCAVAISSTPACPTTSFVDSRVSVHFTVTGSVIVQVTGTLSAIDPGAGNASSSVCIGPPGGACVFERSAAPGDGGEATTPVDELLVLGAGTYELLIVAHAADDTPGVVNAPSANLDISASFFTIANDECVDAQPIELDRFVPFDTSFATTDGPPEACGGAPIPIERDLWYRYDSACDAYLLVSLCGQAEFDTRLAIYDGCPGAGGALLACNDDAPGCPDLTSQIALPAYTGWTYLIRVGGAPGAAGLGGLLVTCEILSDYCIDATPVGAGEIPFSTVGATTDGPPLPPRCAPPGDDQIHDDIWFRFVASCSGELRASTCDAADFDTRLAIYADGCPDDGATPLGCSDDAPGCGSGSDVTIPVSAGATYVIRLGGALGASGHGTLTISATCDGCPGDLGGGAGGAPDGVVDGADLGVLLGDWGSLRTAADLNGDGTVDGADLGLLLGAWGPCP
ncbi:MAG: GC-type dockerin domain-anchored protein [Phycisphaerales bacterium]